MEAMNAVDAPASDINSEASILFGGLFSSYLDSLGDDIRSPKARIAIVRQASDGYMHTEYFAGRRVERRKRFLTYSRYTLT
jgi:hypothetical protein